MDWSKARTWEFEPPDLLKFPLLRLAYEAQTVGGSATCTLNAADEIAVGAFLAGRVSFPGIAEIVEETVEKVPNRTPRSVEEVLEIDRASRKTAQEIADRKSL